jgi:hypothetical protein
MADGFQLARLIPVSGISNNTEAEMRATSALLSVLTIVRDFSVAMLSPLGASTARKASVEAFIETKFKLDDGAVVRPDGVIQISYGASVWKALVEVKTGDNLLEADQLNAYLTLAREQGIDAVLTISNEIGVGAQHPCDGVRIRANSKVRVAHLSWTEVLAHAVRAKVHRGVHDPEQAWILGELIRYLEHPASGAMAFTDMGANWTMVRDAARAGTLRRSDPELRDIVQRWDQLVRFGALRLGSNTGVDVQPVVPRAHADPKVRFGHLADELTLSGLLDATIRIPGAAGDISVVADLRARQITASTDIAAPTDRGSRARVTWLVRQLGPDTPSGATIESWPRHARQPICATLAQAREDRDLLLDPDRREVLRFRLVQRAEMGQNRKDGGRSPAFIESITGLVEAFYGTVLQQIVPWTARPPQARPAARVKGLVEEPINDVEDLDQAIDAARAMAAGETGDGAPPAGGPGREEMRGVRTAEEVGDTTVSGAGTGTPDLARERDADRQQDEFIEAPIAAATASNGSDPYS